jgi:hypothetical protein
MHANPMLPEVHHSHSDRVLRRVLGAMSLFTMFMTIPQVMTIWIGRQAAGVSLVSWSAYLASALVWLCRLGRGPDNDELNGSAQKKKGTQLFFPWHALAGSLSHCRFKHID